jgi:hypothetical protein
VIVNGFLLGGVFGAVLNWLYTDGRSGLGELGKDAFWFGVAGALVALVISL